MIYEKTFLTAIVQLVEQLTHGRHDIQYNDIQHNDILQKGLICDTQHEQHSTQQHSNYVERQNAECCVLFIIMLSVVEPNDIKLFCP